MVDYARKLQTAKIPCERRHDLASALTEAEVHTLQIGTGEAGWFARQLRFDCAMEVGELQRAAEGPCVGDLVKMNATLAELRRGADFTLHFPKGIDPMNCIVVVPADSGHCNGPEHDEIEKYKSVGGNFLLLAPPEFADGKDTPIAIVDWQTGMTSRVCRSTLAAEAAHLANGIEGADWLCVLLEEVRQPDLNLKNWQSYIDNTKQIWITDAKSVFDYLNKESNRGPSKDKRMAIDGALLKESLARPNKELKWIDGSQNIADILTKRGLDKSYARQVVKEGRWTCARDAYAIFVKAKKQQKRSENKDRDKDAKQEARYIKQAKRRARVATKAAEIDDP